MLRNVTLDEISDGKLYEDNDLVRAQTYDCSGCNAVCCKNMEDNIVLDPRDIFEMTRGLEAEGKRFTFNSLVSDKFIVLNLVDNVILPNINMSNESKACSFLDENDRCQIHKHRPGICRMFPLGRYWEEQDRFKYILQVGQCYKNNLTKVRVKEWIGIEEMQEYSSFSSNWHSYLTDVRINLSSLDDKSCQIFNLYNLKTFYETPYRAKDLKGFYREFSMRLRKTRQELNLN